MVASSFAKSMPRVLAYEGGYSNHPRDPGGVTLEGVIQRVYDGYRRGKDKPRRALTKDMRNTPEWKRERDEIYRMQYWNAIWGDKLPAGIDFVVFDGAVNSGPVQSGKWLQRALNATGGTSLIVDGAIGEATNSAAEAHTDHDQLVADICARRLAFMQQLRTWDTFGDGWSARVRNVKTTGQNWASGKTAPRAVAVYKSGGDAKAMDIDVAEAPVSVGQTGAGTTGGLVAYGALDQVQDATVALTPLSDGIQFVKYIVLALTLIASSFMLYGIYRNYKAGKAREGGEAVTV